MTYDDYQWQRTNIKMQVPCPNMDQNCMIFFQIVTKFPASLDIAKFKKIHAFQVNKCSIILLCIYII